MIWRVLLALFLLASPALAQQTHNTVPSATASFITDLQTYLLNEDPNRFKEFFGGTYTISGGTHGTGAGLTKTPTSLLAYPGGYYATESGSITYQDNATCWVVATYTTTSALTGNFVRVSGTKYAIDCVTVGQPTQPANSVYLMKVVTAAGAVTTVTDLRLLSPFITPGVLSLNSLTLTGSANGVTLLTAKRFTDTTPTGNFETFQNAAAGTLWNIDITGTLTAGTIATTTVGPHAIGAAPATNIQVLVSGSPSLTGGTIAALGVQSTIAVPANSGAYGYYEGVTLNKASSGTHADFVGFALDPPTIGAGAATLTNSSTLKITGTPTVGTNRYGLWNLGTTRVDGGVGIGSGTTALGSGLIVGAVADKGAGSINVSSGYYVGGTFALRGYLAGLSLSNDSGSPNTTIDTSAGIAASDDFTVLMALAAFTKTTGAWTLGSGGGCLDTGVVAINTWYHLFVIQRTDTGVVDELCSTSIGSPTFPTSYTKKRRIGSFKTDGASNIILFFQYADEFYWKTPPTIDVSAANPGTAAVTRTLTVPTGVKVQAIVEVGINNSTSNTVAVYLSSLDTTDSVPSVTAAPLATVSGGNASATASAIAQARVWTNASAQIRSRLSASGAGDVLSIQAIGWRDSLGRFD